MQGTSSLCSLHFGTEAEEEEQEEQEEQEDCQQVPVTMLAPPGDGYEHRVK